MRAMLNIAQEFEKFSYLSVKSETYLNNWHISWSRGEAPLVKPLGAANTLDHTAVPFTPFPTVTVYVLKYKHC